MSSRPNGTKILVVESHRRLAAGVGAIVGDGFQVEEARDARQALAALSAGGVVMVVVDDELAAGDPFELCKMARVAEGTPAIVLLASTYLAATRVRAAHSGVDELIPKPAAISEVLTRVWLCLRRRQLEQGVGQTALSMPVAEAPDLSLTLLDAVELMIAGGRTGRVAVASGGRRRGWVAIADGLVVDAQAGPLRGAPALGRLFRWRLTRAEQLIEPVREKVMSVTAPDLCSALFQVRAAWPRLIQALPLEQVLATDFGVWTAAAPDIPSRLQPVLRLFDGRRRLIDVLDDAEIPDPETCRFVSELLVKRVLIPCDPPAEVNSHWDAPNATPEVFFQAPPPDAETPVGWAKTELTPVPAPLPAGPAPVQVAATPASAQASAPAPVPPTPAPVPPTPVPVPATLTAPAPLPRPLERTITSESPVVDPRGLVFGELVEAAKGGGKKRELSDTGTRLGWAALAAGGSPFDSTVSEMLNVASETTLAVRSTMPATPSILIADPQGLGMRETTTTLDQPPNTDTPSPQRRPRLRAVPNPPAAEAGETTDPMIRISGQALDPPPSVRSHSDQWSVAEAPPRRRALMLACVGAVVGMAGSLLVFMRLGAPAPGAQERPMVQSAVQTAAAAPVVAPVAEAQTVAVVPPAAATPAPAADPVAAAAVPAPPTLEDCRRSYARDRYSRIVKTCGLAVAAADAQAVPHEVAGAMAMLAHAELDRGNFSRAGRWARKALALDPKLPEAYAYLGFVEDQAGRRDEAMRAYRSYLKLAPEGMYADDLNAIVNAAP